MLFMLSDKELLNQFISFLNEIEYDGKLYNDLTLDSILSSVIKAVNRCKELSYASTLLTEYLNTKILFSKIKKLILANHDYFLSFKFAKANYKLRNNDNNKTIYFISGLGKNINNIYYTGLEYYNRLLKVNYKDNKYSVAFNDFNSHYYMKKCNHSKYKYYLFDGLDKKEATIITDVARYTLRHNSTNVELVLYEDGFLVYDKKYYDEKYKTHILDGDNALASVQHAYYKNNSSYGIVSIEVFEELDPFTRTIIYLIAVAFLISQYNYMDLMLHKK